MGFQLKYGYMLKYKKLINCLNLNSSIRFNLQIYSSFTKTLIIHNNNIS